MTPIEIFEQFGSLKRGEVSVEDRDRSGRPSKARNEKNVEKINKHHRVTFDQIFEEIGAN